MLHSLTTRHAVLYLRGHLSHSLTSTVELAGKTRSTKHIDFAEKLLKIKNAASEEHLNATTLYKGYLNYRACADQNIVRREKYRALKQQLDSIKDTKRFLQGLPPYEINTTYKSKLCLESIRRDLNYHLAAVYPKSVGAETVSTMINAIFLQDKQENAALNQRAFSQFAHTIHTMINEGCSTDDIVAAATMFTQGDVPPLTHPLQ